MYLEKSMFEPLDEDHPVNYGMASINDEENKGKFQYNGYVERKVSDELINQNEPLQESFQLGDHVYKWCSFAGIPGVFQHHGIVTEVISDKLTVINFDNMIRREGNEQRSLYIRKRKGRICICEEEDGPEWNNVKYKAGWITRRMWRSGTCTAIESDRLGLVLSRVKFILDNPHELPSHHFLRANSECVAVWCKTGAWTTLQASSFLHAYAAGQVKSAGTLALYVSSQQVTGVSLLSTQPYLLPVVAGYGLITVGGPMWILARCKHDWNETTQRLNHNFWEDAINRPEIFAESITKWSDL